MACGLTDEQRLIVETTRAFVENELYPHEAEVERTVEDHGRHPKGMVHGADQHGLLFVPLTVVKENRFHEITPS